MAHFTETDARTIIRDTYGRIVPGSGTVAERLYAPEELEGLPKATVDLALGVGHPVRHARLRPGDVVLDVGCGAGIDTLLAARQVGPSGRVIGLDMTPVMVERTREHAAMVGFGWVEVREGLMEAIPLSDSTVDAVVTNGALNLSTRKSRALAEMLRVLRPGGRLALADLVVTEALPDDVLRSAPALAAWLAGTLAEPVLTKKVLNVGFEAIAIEERRPVGIDELAHYPVFPEELVEFLRRAIPASRQAALVWSVTLTALKPKPWHEGGNPMARILYVGTSGSDDPTRAGFPFHWALGARDAGHDAEIFLAGEATYLMKRTLADAVLPVAMPPLRELIDEVVAQKVPVFVWGKCSVARGVTEDDLKGKNAQFVNPKIFAEKVAAADKVVSA